MEFKTTEETNTSKYSSSDDMMEITKKAVVHNAHLFQKAFINNLVYK